MTLKEAYNFFEILKSNTTKKSEIKVFDKFLDILTELKTREFSIDEIQSIETKLDSLNLKSNPENKKKYYNKAFTQFESYLKDTFSLTSKGYYTNLGMSLGMAFGAAFGAVILFALERSMGITFGISFGMIIGLIIGSYMDYRVKATGNIL